MKQRLQLVKDRRALLALVCGVLLGILAFTVYRIGVEATPPSNETIGPRHPAYLTGFGISSVLWLIGTGFVAFAFGRIRKQRKRSARWAVLLLGMAPVTFVGTLDLLVSPVPFEFVFFAGLIFLAVTISGLVLAILIGIEDWRAMPD